MPLKVEIWKGKKVYVSRTDKGRIETWSYVKGSKLTKSKAAETLRENKTLNKKVKKESVRLTNFTEITLTSDPKNKIKKPTRNAQFVCSCRFRGEIIAARSNKVGSPNTPDGRAAKIQAKNSLLSQLNEKIIGKYEAHEEILDRKEISDYREGWVYYVKIKHT
jgi:hypothetical protein